MTENAVRASRLAAGLSQAALAAATGMSRQAIGAVETGRHRPSVDAALALADALGVSVEQLFASLPAHAEPIFGDAAPEGAAVLAARVDDRLVYAPARAALAYEGWPSPNAVIRDGRPQALPGGDLDGLVVLGCDPALGLAASLGPPAGPRHVHAISASTASALEAMTGGRVHAALVHGRAGRLPRAPAGALRVHVARWRVGVASRGSRPRPLEELFARRVRVVQREDGASAQAAFVAAAASAGSEPPPGPRLFGHIDVARKVADGAAAGVTMEPAAHAFGLAFEPLEEHSVELWVAARHRDHPAVEGLVASLRSTAFTARVACIGGYEL